MITCYESANYSIHETFDIVNDVLNKYIRTNINKTFPAHCT